MKNLKTKETPTKVLQILNSGKSKPPFYNIFHYMSVIGKLNYLEKATISNLSYITHQYAHFTSKPKANHARAIQWIARYLKGTRYQGFIINSNIEKGLGVYVDAAFSGNRDKVE